MFTGLVEALGRVERVEPEGAGRRLTLAWPGLSEALAIGESVAVNGCCLTVVAAEGERLVVQAGPETLLRTNLGDEVGGRPGEPRALAARRRPAGGALRAGARGRDGHAPRAAGRRGSGASSPSRSTRAGPR